MHSKLVQLILKSFEAKPYFPLSAYQEYNFLLGIDKKVLTSQVIARGHISALHHSWYDSTLNQVGLSRTKLSLARARGLIDLKRVR